MRPLTNYQMNVLWWLAWKIKQNYITTSRATWHANSPMAKACEALILHGFARSKISKLPDSRFHKHTYFITDKGREKLLQLNLDQRQTVIALYAAKMNLHTSSSHDYSTKFCKEFAAELEKIKCPTHQHMCYCPSATRLWTK